MECDHNPKKSSSASFPEMIDLRAMAGVLWYHKLLIGIVSLAAAAGAYLLSATKEPLYTSETLIGLNQRALNIVQFDDLVGEMEQSAATIDGEVLYLTSLEFLGKIAKRLNLALNAGSLDRYLLAEVARQVDKTPRGDAPGYETALSLQQYVTAARIGDSYIVSVTVSRHDPEEAAMIANMIAREYLREQKEKKVHLADKTLHWLDKRIAALQISLRSLEGEIVKYRASNNLADAQEGGSAEVQQAALAAQLAAMKIQRAEAEARLAQLEGVVRSGGPARAAELLTTAMMVDLRAQETLLMRRLAELRLEYGDRHPAMVTLMGELNGIREKKEEEVSRVAQDMKNEVAVAEAREVEIAAHLDAIKAASSKLERASIDVRDKQRTAETNRELLTKLLTRRQEIAEQRQIQSADAHIVSAASVPPDPSSKPPLLLAAIGLIAGGGLASVSVLFMDRLRADYGFLSLESLRDAGQPTLGVIPNVLDRERQNESLEDFAINHPDTSTAESFQHVRTRLIQRCGIQNRVVLVTSSIPIEGKSATSAVLARQMALAGMNTLLIDADFRRPRIHDIFGASNEWGLADVLQRNIPLRDVVDEDALSHLHILPAGRCPASPPDLLRSKAMAAFLEQCRDDYDYVILDSPPLAAVSDSLVMASLVDGCIYVVRWRYTPRKIVLDGIDQLKESGGHLAGIVLTRVDSGEARMKYGAIDRGQYYRHYHSSHA